MAELELDGALVAGIVGVLVIDVFNVDCFADGLTAGFVGFAGTVGF